MTEDRLHRDQVRAARAKALLEDDLLKEAFDWLEKEYIRVWKDSQPRDEEGRQLIWQQLQALSQVRVFLQAVFDRGKVALDELDRIMAERRQG